MKKGLRMSEKLDEILKEYALKAVLANKADELASTYNGTRDAMARMEYSTAEAKQAIFKWALDDIIGDDWGPCHEPYRDTCRQCINRSQRNIQMFEQRQKLNL